MPLIRWEPVMESGVDFMDADHRDIVACVGRLDDLSRQGRLVSEGRPLFLEFVDHMRRHIAHEEQVMADHGYPERVAHCREHERFLEQMGYFSTHFGSANVVLHDELLVFLGAWLIGHVMGTDHRLAHHLQPPMAQDLRRRA